MNPSRIDHYDVFRASVSRLPELSPAQDSALRGGGVGQLALPLHSAGYRDLAYGFRNDFPYLPIEDSK